MGIASFPNFLKKLKLKFSNPKTNRFETLKISKSLNLYFSNFQTLMSFRNTSSAKRMKTGAIRSGGKLEGWFSGIFELINKYLYETIRKIVNTPKLVSFTWKKQQNLSIVRSLLKEQRLKRFLKLTGNIYPNLVNVFYANLQFNGDSLVSHVKGVDMVITNDVGTTVTGLKFSGVRINRGNLAIVEEFNKMQFYKSCLKNPLSKVRNFSVGGLKA